MAVAVSWQDLKRHELKWLVEIKGLMHLAGKQWRPNCPAAVQRFKIPRLLFPDLTFRHSTSLNGPSMCVSGLLIGR